MRRRTPSTELAKAGVRALAPLALAGAAFAGVGCPGTGVGPLGASVLAAVVAASPSPSPDPGTLPQSRALPSVDATFRSHLQELLDAIGRDEPALAMPAFFPLSAYIQTKGISDPAHDWHTRLVADYAADIASLHASFARFGGVGRLVGVSAPASAAEWILPGVEWNKGSYWRLYGAVVTFALSDQLHSFAIASIISWRGEWYVVHLVAIR